MNSVVSDFTFTPLVYGAKRYRYIMIIMTGDSKWQDKHKRRLEALVYDVDFQKDLKDLPDRSENETFLFALFKLTEKYDLPLSAASIIDGYLKTGELSAQAAHSGLLIICDYDQTAGPAASAEQAEHNYTAHRGFTNKGIELFMPPGTSAIEAKSFIDDHWRYIESKIGKPDRIRRHSTAERNAKILALHKEGLSNEEIINQVRSYPGNLITDDIGIIIRKNK